MFLSGEKVEGERCMSPQGSSVKGSSQQSSISFPKVKGGGPLFSGLGPLVTGGLVNDTTPVADPLGYFAITHKSDNRYVISLEFTRFITRKHSYTMYE